MWFWIALGLLFLVLALFTVLVLSQKWLLYLPQVGFKRRIFPWDKQVPEDAKGSLLYSHLLDPNSSFNLDYEDIMIPVLSGHAIHSWFIRAVEEPQTKPTVVFFHGNAGSIALRLPLFADLIHSLGCNVFAVEYRGYGKSQGTPTERDMINDAYSAIELLFSTKAGASSHPFKLKYMALMNEKGIQIDHGKIFVFGRSLGGAVTIGTLATFPGLANKLRGFIVENTFLSIRHQLLDMLRRGSRMKMLKQVLSYVLPLFLTLRWKSYRRISNIRLPGLLLSSRRDNLVPPKHMDELWRRFISGSLSGNDKSLSKNVKFPKGNHNNTFTQAGYFESLSDFIEQIVAI